MRINSLIFLVLYMCSNVFSGLSFDLVSPVDVVEGDTITISILSDSDETYCVYLDCDGAVITEPVARPAAGTISIAPNLDSSFCGYDLCTLDPLVTTPGEHFTFTLITNSGDAGQTFTLTLYDYLLTNQVGTLSVNVVEAECLKSTASYYNDWLGSVIDPNLTWSKPDCWCYYKQCGGDADGLSVGTSFTGIRWCTTADLNIFLAAFNIYEPGGTLNSGAGVGQTGICADFDHSGVGTAFTGIRRVTTTDLDILLTGFNNYEVHPVLGIGSGITECDPDNYNFFIIGP